MNNSAAVDEFLSQYDQLVTENAQLLRDVLKKELPGIKEQLDLPAKMIAYVYGQKYAEMICTIIPSKKGLKLGFYKGADLPDPEGLLKGTGKISRYVEIKSEDEIKSAALKQLIAEGLAAYRERVGK